MHKRADTVVKSICLFLYIYLVFIRFSFILIWQDTTNYFVYALTDRMNVLQIKIGKVDGIIK